MLFTIVPTGGATLDEAAVGLLDLATGQRKVLIQGGGDAEYAASGHIVYAVSGSLRAVPSIRRASRWSAIRYQSSDK